LIQLTREAKFPSNTEEILVFNPNDVAHNVAHAIDNWIISISDKKYFFRNGI